jgi:Bacterial low temperature requirement A protein (LtrA)
VAVIGQAAHHLAERVSGRGVAEFAVVFALIWIAWINGSLYLDPHGREDGRTRSLVFVQMGILALLAVFTADATDGSGRGFAVVYAIYQVLQTGLWYSVWLRDRRDHPSTSKLAQPDRIQGVGLGTPGQMLDVSGVDQPGLEPVRFKQVEDSLPVVRGCLHDHPGHPQLPRPVDHDQQPAGHRLAAPDLPRPPAVLAWAGHPHIAGQLGLAHVQRGYPLDDLLGLLRLLQHPGLPVLQRPTGSRPQEPQGRRRI